MRKPYSQSESAVRSRAQRRKRMREDASYWRKKFRDYSKKWRAEHKNTRKFKLQSREYFLRKKFGIDLPRYYALLRAQGGCAICGRKKPERGRRHFAVDHCHKTGRIRGLLCFKCNTGIGSLRDDPNLLQKALRYLTK